MALDILILTDDSQRASWYFDRAGHDVRDTLQEIHDGINHYFDTHGNADDGGEDKLPEGLCGAVCATLAATILYGVATAPNPEDVGDFFAMMANINEAAGYAEHAMDHNDSMAVEVFFPGHDDDSGQDNVGAVVERLTSWVLAHLPESDPDAFLASLSLEAEVSES